MPNRTASDPVEQIILSLLNDRGPGKSICPSDAARCCAANTGHPAEWRQYLQPVRDAAARLASAGALIVTQGDHAIDIASAKGPIRFRKP